MNRDEAIKFLSKDGNLGVPCSRYGRNTEECAPVAYAVARILSDETGEKMTVESLDHAMYLVVNDHDDVADLILDHGTTDEQDAAGIPKFGRMGYEAGAAAGSWIIDGNTDAATARRILNGYENGDPEILDMMPAPLSGETGGESPTEILTKYAASEYAADLYEQGYERGYWDRVVTAARTILD